MSYYNSNNPYTYSLKCACMCTSYIYNIMIVITIKNFMSAIGTFMAFDFDIIVFVYNFRIMLVYCDMKCQFGCDALHNIIGALLFHCVLG